MKTIVLNCTDSARHYAVAIGDEVLSVSSEIVRNLHLFPAGSQYIDVGRKTFSIRVSESGSVEDWQQIGATEIIGDLADLLTDHKSSIVEAINELAGLIETPELSISFQKSSSELKDIYNRCVEHPQLCREVVFINGEDGLTYTTNGWKVGSGAIYFHVIMNGDGGITDTTITLSSNGTLSV